MAGDVLLPCVGPENDYRAIASREPVGVPRVAVVVPVYNRVDQLSRTLAGLAIQSFSGDMEVIVADDGSTEDVAAAAEVFGGQLDLRTVRQERDGFGLARARNLGAAATDADVLIFLDGDSIPVAEFVERHAWWHARAGNLVVAGSRRHVDAAAVTPEDIAAGRDGLAEQASFPGDDEPLGPVPDDWRRVFYRRTKGVLLGDIAFRAGVGSNFSVRRDRFEAVGGFSEAFRAWGGEDTECMWRLWNSGMFVVPENRALVLHQIQDDDPGDWRTVAGRRAAALVADLVPHRFYRKDPTPFATVPKVSWVAAVTDSDEAQRLWREMSLATYIDSEAVFWGPSEAVGHLLSAGAASTRTTAIADGEASGCAAALDAARGELVAFIDGRAHIERWLLARCVKRLERDSRAAAVQVGYEIGADRYRRRDELLQVDGALGRHGLPLFGVLRRRELLKDRSLLRAPGSAWAATLDRGRVELLINDLASVSEADVDVAGRRPGIGDLAAAGVEEVARAAVRAVRRVRTRTGEEPSPPAPDVSPRPKLDYIGFTGKNNLGDEAILTAVQHLLPWAEVGRGLDGARVLMVGGGTLVNGRNYYLTRVLRRDSPTLEKVVFGVGVRSPEFWGVTEPVAEWWSLFDAARYVGVRGPDSVANLRTLGYGGKVEVLGDPGLSLRPPADVDKVPGRVVVCPVWTGGLLHGEDDAAVFADLAETIRGLRGEGREVVMLSAFPEDDRHLLQLMRDAGDPGMPYVAGYESIEATLALLASARLVIAERLHGAILAAASGTPFVAIEYRPKIRDFARTVDQEDAVIRTDETGHGRLQALVARVDAESGRADAIEGAVAKWRALQAEVASSLEADLS